LKKFNQCLAQKTEIINQEIHHLLDFWNLPEPLNSAIHYLLESGGKRIRPVLTLIACKAVGGSIDSSVTAAIAIELIHNASLLWDDVIDADELRRGKITVHKKWDKNVAILAGAMISTKALELISDDTDILSLYLNALGTMIEGQMIDISKSIETPNQLFESKNESEIFEVLRNRFQKKVYEGLEWEKDIDFPKIMEFTEFEEERTYFNMISKKTSTLFKLATSMGALLGGGTPEEINALSDYGFYLGLAFQVRDDLIGLISNEEALGKPVGSDLRQRKLNLYTIFGLRNLSNEKLDELFSLMQDFVDLNSIQKIQQILEDCGALDYANEKLQSIAENARKALLPLKESDSKAILNQLVNFIIERRG